MIDEIEDNEGGASVRSKLNEAINHSNAIEAIEGVSGLTGGTAGKLDAVPTVDITVPFVAHISVGGQLYIYNLVAGTDAESSPDVVRPDDYNGATNAKVWKLLSRSKAGRPMVKADDNLWYQLHIVGGAVAVGDTGEA